MKDKTLQNLKICRGHLFYVESTKKGLFAKDFRSLCALSIEEALSVAEIGPVELEIGSNYAGISRLRLGIIEGDGSYESRNGNVQYLIHSWPRKHDPPQIVFSIIGADSPMYCGDTRFGSYCAAFDPREGATTRWTLLKSEKPVDNPSVDRQYLTTEVSLSGRVLVTSTIDGTAPRYTSTRTYSIIVLDRKGLLRFTRITNNTLSKNPRDSSLEKLYLDEYSEALLVEKRFNDLSGLGEVEFYYPSLITKIPDGREQWSWVYSC